jgi:endonuclease YncB( thermonuclease family)
MGWLEAVLICLALVAVFPIFKDSRVNGDREKPLLEEWLASVERWLSKPEAQPDSPTKHEFADTARVVKVKDGDSLVMRFSDGESVEARLYGIDAPEYSQAHGDAAKRALSLKVTMRKVRFREINVDSYGRRVVVLFRNDRNINAEMVCEGHAWWYRRHARSEKALEDCEAKARADRLGLWRDQDPVPPWSWRRSRRS